MKILAFIQTIRAGLRSTGEKITVIFHNGRQWAIQKKNALTQKVQQIWNNIPFCKNVLEPIFQRIFKPLKKKDLVIVGCASILAIIVIKVAISIFGNSVLPLAGAGGALLVIGGCLKVHNRIRREYHEKAWHILERIRQHTHVLAQPYNKYIEQHMKTLLINSEFQHIRDEFEKLQGDLNNLKTELQKPDRESYRNISSSFIQHLKTYVTSEDDKRKIEILDAHVKKAGTENFESHKMMEQCLTLNHIKTVKEHEANFKSSLSQLQQHLNNLVANINRNNHKIAKDHFKDIAEILQRKLVPDWDPRKFGPNFKLEKDETEKDLEDEKPLNAEKNEEKEDIEIDIEGNNKDDDIELDVEPT